MTPFIMNTEIHIYKETRKIILKRSRRKLIKKCCVLSGSRSHRIYNDRPLNILIVNIQWKLVYCGVIRCKSELRGHARQWHGSGQVPVR
jgi:hypothetical protein